MAQPANRTPQHAGGLASNLCRVDEIAPNPWNPNRMDDFMRKKLARSIKKDGFVIPILVRPHPAGTPKWEIVDGEQRWQVANDVLDMEFVPYLNLGPISDEKAKQITIKANTLRGEFDSVELGKMIKDLADAEGFQSVVDDLPYTPERLQGLIDLVDSGLNLTAPTGPISGDQQPADPAPGHDFKSFDPSAMKFDHRCARCGFEFNSPKPEAPAEVNS